MISAQAMEASKAALASLAGLSIDPKAADNTLDGLVREMLRPMLKHWLDANLPDLVERVVTREVARVIGR
jgi:cell pole-organizing protein PopZ